MTSFSHRAAERHRFTKAAAATLALASLACGCAPLLISGAVVGSALIVTDRRTAGTQVDDEAIELKANSRMNEAFGDRARVSTTSYNLIVLLTGEVANGADKAKAVQIVAGIDNVKSIVNELMVGPQNSFSEKTKDTFVTTKVKASLLDAKDLFANSIKVVTNRGVVYLMGRLTEREATRASEVARGVSGVVKVVRVFDIVTESELASTQRKEAKQP